MYMFVTERSENMPDQCDSSRVDPGRLDSGADLTSGRVDPLPFYTGFTIVIFSPRNFNKSMTKCLCLDEQIYEHEISNNVVCATSKSSDQPAHTHSLV